MTAATFRPCCGRRSRPPTLKGFARRKRESRKRGKLRGLGIGNFLEVTAPPSKEMGGIIFEPDGGVTLLTGTMDFGMGHASPFAQVLSEKLGIPFEKIRLVQGDSDRLVAGRRQRRLQIHHVERHRDRGGGRQGDRARPPDRLARAGGRRRRHRVQGRQLRHRRHRPRHRHHGAGREDPRRDQLAGRRAGLARRAPCQRRHRRHLPQRLPCRRGRDRSRYRRDRGGANIPASTISAPSSIR